MAKSILQKLKDTIGDMTGHSHYAREKSFLKRLGVNVAYSRQDHDAYLDKLKADGKPIQLFYSEFVSLVEPVFGKMVARPVVDDDPLLQATREADQRIIKTINDNFLSISQLKGTDPLPQIKKIECKKIDYNRLSILNDSYLKPEHLTNINLSNGPETRTVDILTM